MATSGNYRNFYVNSEGKRVAHTIDPRTASPVAYSLLSATVVAPSCAMADAYATAFMVVGLEKAQQILEAHSELSAYLIYEEADSIKVFSTLND
jgi:thiamine biosynthesis lipoprotein